MHMQDEAAVRWSSVFKRCYRANGATREDIQAIFSLLAMPLSEEEVASINSSQTNPFPKTDPLYNTYKPQDAARWVLPTKPLPPSYLAFLCWSNGGSFFNDDRSFDPFFSAAKIRGYLLGYHVPQYMPGAMPFAFDGGGRFYLFDMRLDPVGGEYPILFVGSGNLNYDDAVLVAPSFPDACRGTSNPADQYMN